MQKGRKDCKYLGCCLLDWCTVGDIEAGGSVGNEDGYAGEGQVVISRSTP